MNTSLQKIDNHKNHGKIATVWSAEARVRVLSSEWRVREFDLISEEEAEVGGGGTAQAASPS